MPFSCPICGCPGLDEDPRLQTFEICPCCGNEFGYEDSVPPGPDHAERQRRRWRYLRLNWLLCGGGWSNADERPDNWDAAEQLRASDEFAPAERVAADDDAAAMARESAAHRYARIREALHRPRKVRLVSADGLPTRPNSLLDLCRALPAELATEKPPVSWDTAIYRALWTRWAPFVRAQAVIVAAELSLDVLRQQTVSDAEAVTTFDGERPLADCVRAAELFRRFVRGEARFADWLRVREYWPCAPGRVAVASSWARGFRYLAAAFSLVLDGPNAPTRLALWWERVQRRTAATNPITLPVEWPVEADLLAHARDGEADMQRAALGELTWLGSDDAVPELARIACEDANAEIKIEAAYAIWGIATLSAKTALAGLEERDLKLPKSFAEIPPDRLRIGEADIPAAVESMIAATGDERAEWVRALGKVNSPRMREAMFEVLKNPAWRARKAAVMVLAHIATPTDIAALEAAHARETAAQVKQAIARTIAAIDGAHSPS